MTRRSLVEYVYNPVPEILPPSRHAVGIIDTLDSNIESLWNEEIRKLMNPVGHPQSKRFFIQQYQAVQILQAEASLKGIPAISNADMWTLMKALRRVATRRGISPKALRITAVAAE